MSGLATQERRKINRAPEHNGGPDPLHALTALFLSVAPQFDEDGIEIANTAFYFALRRPNSAALTDISVRMALVPNAPSRLIKLLASDADISVAGPVLSYSPRLSETDLCEIAAVVANSHLLAISTRKHLTSPVTDILIARGDNEVARNLAKNKNAELSDDGVACLLARAKSDEAIGAVLQARADLPRGSIRSGLANAALPIKSARVTIAAAKRLARELDRSGELINTSISIYIF